VNLVRASVFASAALLLGGGYFASQRAYFDSLRPESRDATRNYVASIDASPVWVLALLILVACVVFVSLPQKEGEE
jgi:hypothetical protein